MSVSVDSQSTTSSKPTDGASDSPRETPEVYKPADLPERAAAFRALMNGVPLTAEQLTMLGERGKNGGHGNPGHGNSEHKHREADVPTMLDVQRTIELATPPAVPVPQCSTPPDMSIAELIDKHVKRLLASQGAGSARSGEVRLELSDAVLPGTSLSLRQTADGWQLSAMADNKQSLDRLNEFAPALVKRFSQASLGRLEISVESDRSLQGIAGS